MRRFLLFCPCKGMGSRLLRRGACPGATRDQTGTAWRSPASWRRACAVSSQAGHPLSFFDLSFSRVVFRPRLWSDRIGSAPAIRPGRLLGCPSRVVLRFLFAALARACGCVHADAPACVFLLHYVFSDTAKYRLPVRVLRGLACH